MQHLLFQKAPGFLLTTLLPIEGLWYAALLCTILIGVMILYMFYVLYLSRRRARKRALIKDQWAQVIAEVLIAEDAGQVPEHLHQTLRNAFTRRIVTRELIKTRNSLSGEAGICVQQLYEKLGLQYYSARRLNSRHWHIKTRAIQELYIMGQQQYSKKIFRLTNHSNYRIRREAQTGMVHFYGAVGLRFLNVLTYPITEWHQINLLHQLELQPPQPINNLEQWLHSTNNSVVVFSLKLCRIYQRYDLHDLVLTCVDHVEEAVQMEALQCLQTIGEERTAVALTQKYPAKPAAVQQAIVRVLAQIGTAGQQSWLSQTMEEADEITRLAIARTWATLMPQHIDTLRQYGIEEEYVEQLKLENG